MISDYASLIAHVGEWAGRPDLLPRVQSAIALAEDYFNSTLRVPQMEQRATATEAASLPMPTDFLELRNIRVNSDPVSALSYVTAQYADEFYGTSTTGRPLVYTIYDNQFFFYPPPDVGYTVEIDYYQQIPALSGTNTTNWLLTRYPRAYLFGSLCELLSLSGDPRAAEAQALREKVCAQIQEEGERRQFSGAPLFIRPMVQIA